MIQHQGTIEWDPHMGSTPLYLGVVLLLCIVSVRITPHDLMNILSIIEYTKDLYNENFGYVLTNMRMCCCDLVGVDSKTLVHFLLCYFILFYFPFFFFDKTPKFGIRLK
jgi:hypothetical protein